MVYVKSRPLKWMMTGGSPMKQETSISENVQLNYWWTSHMPQTFPAEPEFAAQGEPQSLATVQTVSGINYQWLSPEKRNRGNPIHPIKLNHPISSLDLFGGKPKIKRKNTWNSAAKCQARHSQLLQWTTSKDAKVSELPANLLQYIDRFA